jgi:hypothetical protein
MSSNVGLVAGPVATGEGAMALSDLSVTEGFLCLRVTVLLARAGAAPEDTAGSELVLLLVAIQGISLPKFQLDSSILADFTARAAKSFYQLHHNFNDRDISDGGISSAYTEVY